MKVVGCGQAGMKLAAMFDKSALLISTAHQDSFNFKGLNIKTFVGDGAGKRFQAGVKIWQEHFEELKECLKEIKDDKVIVFSSLGGGSGSSSLQFVSNILIENKNKILVVGVLPFKGEVNPPLSNAVQSINSLTSIISEISVMLFDNQILVKKYDGDWSKINSEIVTKTNYVVNLLDKYAIDGYSPTSIDRSELESVVFGGGFIDVSDDCVEEKVPKFDYGSIDENTKNVLIAMFVHRNATDATVDSYHKILTDIQNKFAKKAQNSRIVPGIIRGNINETRSEKIKDRAYITIASGLSIDKYMEKVEKMRDEAIEKASAYSTKTKVEKVVSGKEAKIIDI